MRWDTMRGDERERYCSKCAHSVVNISLLTTVEREALLANPPPGGLCVSYYQRLSGEYVSAEKPFTAAETRRLVQWGVIAASAATLATAAHFAPEISASAGSGVGPAGSAISQACADLKERGHEILYDLGLISHPPPVYVTMGVMVCPPPSATAGGLPVASVPDDATAPIASISAGEVTAPTPPPINTTL